MFQWERCFFWTNLYILFVHLYILLLLFSWWKYKKCKERERNYKRGLGLGAKTQHASTQGRCSACNLYELLSACDYVGCISKEKETGSFLQLQFSCCPASVYQSCLNRLWLHAFKQSTWRAIKGLYSPKCSCKTSDLLHFHEPFSLYLYLQTITGKSKSRYPLSGYPGYTGGHQK